jgi:hypothetical protein
MVSVIPSTLGSEATLYLTVPSLSRIAQPVDSVSVHPNPFNPRTAITFHIRTAAKVRLDIYSITGQKVKTLTDGSYPPGEHTVFFDARGLASGVYLFRLIAGDWIHTGKLLFIR